MEGFRRFVRVLWLGYLFLRRPQEAYSLMGLIRGPDFPGGGTYLKRFFTERLRGFFFPPNSVQGSMRDTPLMRSIVHDLYEELRNLGWEVQQGRRSSSNANHYLIHAAYAIGVLANLPLQTREEKVEIQALDKLLTLLQGGAGNFTYLTEMRLLRWFDEQFLRRPPHHNN